MLNVMVVMGTRPEIIKLAPVVNRLRQTSEVRVRLIFTGQHRELADGLADFFELVPDTNLHVMTNDQSPSFTAAAVLRGMEDVLAEGKPDLLMVQGDTTTSFAAAATAYFHQIPIAHVEAGLRTYDKYSPFPEEINRRWTAVVTDFHFAPTARARENLLREGIAGEMIYVTGNTGIDAIQDAVQRLETTDPPVSVRCNHAYILLTVHRRENHGKRLAEICKATRNIVSDFPDYHVILPVHANPNVRTVVRHLLGGTPQIHLVPALDYISFVAHMQRSHIIMTDSGGVQEEAPVFKKPIFVIRDTTERPEGIEARVAELVGCCAKDIVTRVGKVLSNPAAYRSFASAVNPYGDGLASARICNVLGKSFGIRSLVTEVPSFAGTPCFASASEN